MAALCQPPAVLLVCPAELLVVCLHKPLSLLAAFLCFLPLQAYREWDFSNMLTILLRFNGRAVAAAVVRVFGSQLAELPLVATRPDARRLGHARVLVRAIEATLAELGVEVGWAAGAGLCVGCLLAGLLTHAQRCPVSSSHARVRYLPVPTVTCCSGSSSSLHQCEWSGCSHRLWHVARDHVVSAQSAWLKVELCSTYKHQCAAATRTLALQGCKTERARAGDYNLAPARAPSLLLAVLPYCWQPCGPSQQQPSSLPDA